MAGLLEASLSLGTCRGFALFLEILKYQEDVPPGTFLTLPPTLVANALGYSYQVIHKHAADAGAPMAGYAGKGPLPR